MEPSNSIDLIVGCRDGDEDAARGIFVRYVGELVSLAQRRMSAKISKRVDPEDVVQSAFRTFFRHAKEGHFELEDGHDLWQLLAGITMNKVRQSIEFHTAQKRHIDAEASPSPGTDHADLLIEGLSRDPSPEAAAIVTDEIDAVMHDMDADKRRMVELRLEGYQLEEIAAETARAERTVRRTLKTVRDRLEERFTQSGSTD